MGLRSMPSKPVLNEEQVTSILKRLSDGDQPRKLARAYGVSNTLVHLILRNKKWRHVLAEKRDAITALYRLRRSD